MPNKADPPPAPYALPFVVAVTGHRDIHPDDAAYVQEQVFQAIETIAAALPHSPIHFLTALADGADQLFAEQVLRLQQQCRQGTGKRADRIRLVVPLPMPIETYCIEQAGGAAAERQDYAAFEAAHSAFAARLERYASKASSIFVIPERKLDASAGAAATAESEPYANLARYLGIHAHAVIAIWDGRTELDGQFPRQAGGTQDLVLSLLDGFERHHHARSAGRFAERETGNVIHIYCRRAMPSAADLPAARERGAGFAAAHCANSHGPVCHIAAPDAHWPGVHAPRLAQWLRSPAQACEGFQFHRAWRSVVARTQRALDRRLDPARLAVLYRIWAAGKQVDTLNRLHQRALSGSDAVGARRYAESLNDSRADFLSSLPKKSAEPADAVARALGAPLRAYCVADVQASRAKRFWRYRWLFIAMAAILAASSSSLRLLDPSHGDLIEGLSFGIGAILAVAVYLWVGLSSQRNAYLEYRALAEGLRVQMIWLAAGEDTLVTDHYVQKFRHELDWIRHAIDACLVMHPVPRLSALQVARGCIAHQAGYLAGAANRRRYRLHVRSTTLGNNMLLTGLMLSAAAVMLVLGAGQTYALLLTLLIVGMKLFTDVGTAWLTWNGKMGHSETLKQADHLRGVYRRAQEALIRIEQTALSEDEKERRARDLLFALGTEVLAENANWLATYLQRRIQAYGK
jgi:hypothetical protein